MLRAIPFVLSQVWCLTTGVTSAEAQPQRSEQANRYAEVVRGVNKALVSESRDQFDAVNTFLAACPEEDNGQHCHHSLQQPKCTMQLLVFPPDLKTPMVAWVSRGWIIRLLLHPGPTAQTLHILHLAKQASVAKLLAIM